MGTPIRVRRWADAWAHRDPEQPHWHLGPVAVDSHPHGQGIGGAMLSAFCERMDQEHTLSYLETDKFENVRFYQKFGFTVVAESNVLGVPNWFMSRTAPTESWTSRLLNQSGAKLPLIRPSNDPTTVVIRAIRLKTETG